MSFSLINKIVYYSIQCLLLEHMVVSLRPIKFLWTVLLGVAIMGSMCGQIVSSENRIGFGNYANLLNRKQILPGPIYQVRHL